MVTICSLSPKGGAGKSTLLYNLAQMLHIEGYKTLVLDSDPNSSLFNMYERRIDSLEAGVITDMNFPEVQAFRPSVAKLGRQLESLGKGFDVIIVDTYGKIENFHTDLAFHSDIVLIPTTPLKAAINSAIEACEHLDKIQKENEGFPVYGVAMLNFQKNGRAERSYRKMFADESRFSKETRPYECYKIADIDGLTVTELDKVLPTKSEREKVANASIDMRNLCKQIVELVKGVSKHG